MSYASILIPEHDGDARRAVIVWAADCLEPNQRRRSILVVVADMDGEANLRSAAPSDGQPEHPNDIPQPAGFILTSHTRRDSNASLPHGPCQGDRKAETRFLGRAAHVDQNAVLDGLSAAVPMDLLEHGFPFLFKEGRRVFLARRPNRHATDLPA